MVPPILLHTWNLQRIPNIWYIMKILLLVLNENVTGKEGKLSIPSYVVRLHDIETTNHVLNNSTQVSVIGLSSVRRLEYITDDKKALETHHYSILTLMLKGN